MRFREALKGSEYEFFINKCISCGELVCLKIRIKPPTAGARVLSINSGGTRGIVPIGILIII